MRIVESANAELPVGTTYWLLSTPRDDFGNSIPVAAAGGWLDEHTLRRSDLPRVTARMNIICFHRGGLPRRPGGLSP
jgi:hypothetical protein